MFIDKHDGGEDKEPQNIVLAPGFVPVNYDPKLWKNKKYLPDVNFDPFWILIGVEKDPVTVDFEIYLGMTDEYEHLFKDGDRIRFTNRKDAMKFKKQLESDDFNENVLELSEKIFEAGISKSPTEISSKIKEGVKKIKINELYTS